jgi:hypothetical protein
MSIHSNWPRNEEDGLSGEGLPVWKRGSIAAEPEVVAAGAPLFIDTASRLGMSGSPVIRRSRGSHALEGNEVSIGGIATRFVGVYSGRLTSADPLDAQLGLCWPALLVSDVIKERERDAVR